MLCCCDSFELPSSGLPFIHGPRWTGLMGHCAGEEAKVVVVSLVRCNKEGKAGFLNTSNRINVLLSRAMHGMVLVGSTKTFKAARTTPM